MIEHALESARLAAGDAHPSSPVLNECVEVLKHLRGYRERDAHWFRFSEESLARVEYEVSRARDNLGSPQAALEYLWAAMQHASVWPDKIGSGDAGRREIYSLVDDVRVERDREVRRLKSEIEALRGELEEVRGSTRIRAQKVAATLDEIRGHAVHLDKSAEAQMRSIREMHDVERDKLTELRSFAREKLDGIAVESRTTTGEHTKALEAVVSDAREKSAAIVVEMSKRNEEVKNLEALEAGAVFAQKFGKEASTSRLFGLIFLGLGLAVVGLVIWGLIHWLLGTDGETSWQSLAARFGVGLVGGGAAAVLVRLAMQYLAQSRAVRRTELEIRAIHPFLANVSDTEQKDTAVIAMIERTFGHEHDSRQPPGGGSKATDTFDATALSEIVKALGPLLNRS